MTTRVLPASAPDSIEQAAATLAAGGVVAIPTETVYGLAALPLATPLARLVEIKRRSPEKGIALLVDSIAQVAALADVPDAARRLAASYWPGPLTLVLPLAAGAQPPELLTGGRGTLGFRLPDHEVPRLLARRLGPFAASSANISGEPEATTAATVLRTLGGEVDLVLDDGPVRGGVPSTVVAFDPAQPAPVILREGAVPASDVLAAAG